MNGYETTHDMVMIWCMVLSWQSCIYMYMTVYLHGLQIVKEATIVGAHV